jgi:glycosyltransferase involved in cell wall biosynthesis
MNNGVILASLFSSLSIGQQANLIKRLFEENKYIVIPHNEYFSTPSRNWNLRAFLFFTFISNEPKWWAMALLGQYGRKICYATCEGSIDKEFHTPGLYNQFELYANSGFTKRFMEEAGFKVKGVVHHAVDLKEVKQARDNPIFYKKPNDKFVWFIYVGQGYDRKRPDLMLEAFRKAQQKTNYNIGLLAISDIQQYLKPDDKNIIQIASPGSLSHLDVLRYIAGADYYLHLSRAEGFGLPVLESRAVGTPLICLKMSPTIEFTPPGSALWVDVNGFEIKDNIGYIKFYLHNYDLDEASDVIAQAYDIYINQKSKYEDMKAKCLEGIEEYDYHNKYKVFL